MSAARRPAFIVTAASLLWLTVFRLSPAGWLTHAALSAVGLGAAVVLGARLRTVDLAPRRLLLGAGLGLLALALTHVGYRALSPVWSGLDGQLSLLYAVEVGERGLATRIEARLRKLPRTAKAGLAAANPDVVQLLERIGLDA